MKQVGKPTIKEPHEYQAGPGWPGGTFNGNLNTEIDFFLTKAMAFAKEVAEAIQISDKIEDYMNMFNQYDLSSNKEVLLWRIYSADATSE